MGYEEEVCIFCGAATETFQGTRGHGLKRRSDDEQLGRLCDECVEAELEGVPEGENCVACDAAAAYAYVPLTLERSAEGDVPNLLPDGAPTPVLCSEHFRGLVE